MDMYSLSGVTVVRAPSFQSLICGGSPGSRPGGEGEQRRGQKSPADKWLKRPAREAGPPVAGSERKKRKTCPTEYSFYFK